VNDLATRAEALRALHRPGTPLVLRNAWDAASAKALVADAPALATTSVGLAQSLGTRTAATSPPTRPSPPSPGSWPRSTFR
jgi:2-methylisocitrate lyase-like PEP mutase family enzyme